MSTDAKRLVIDVPDEVSPAVLSSLGKAVGKALRVLNGELPHNADQLAAFLVEAAVPPIELVKERVERRKTINTLMTQTEWLTAAEIQSSHAGHPGIVADWKRRGKVFAVKGTDGKDLFPAYQFDAAMRPLPVIKRVLQEFGAVADPWTLVAWFHYPNG